MFRTPELKYDPGSFKKLSKKSFDIHYGKHHATYVDNLNNLVEQDDFLKGKSLEEIIKYSYKRKEDAFYLRVYNNAAQHWNHSFFWESIKPEVTLINGEVKEALEAGFGSTIDFYLLFEKIGLSVFGSGWVWIVYNKSLKKLEIHTTSNADNMMMHEGLVPLLVCDIWEHAYYIDYLNDRKEFLKSIFECLNWEFARENYLNQ